MSDPYTIKRLTEVEDVAAKFGHGDAQEVRFANADLAAEATGLSLHRIKPGKRQPFGHRHEEAEEVYVVIAGGGRVNLDGDIVELERLDAVRVAPGVTAPSRPGTRASRCSPSAPGTTATASSCRAGGASARSRIPRGCTGIRGDLRSPLAASGPAWGRKEADPERRRFP